jgi:hypothetical protein
VPNQQGVVPVEAKSGSAGKLRSLREFVMRNGSRLAVRLYAGEYAVHPIDVGDSKCRLINIPYYAAGLISRNGSGRPRCTLNSQRKVGRAFLPDPEALEGQPGMADLPRLPEPLRFLNI